MKGIRCHRCLACHKCRGRRRWVLAVLLVCVAGSAANAQEASGSGIVLEVRVHGNHTTPDADVLGIVGNVVGQPATEALIAAVKSRLDTSGRFEGVEVRKRFRSIDNPDDILLMVIVDEVPGISDTGLTPGAWTRFRTSGMFLPVLNYVDGYGFTYGARVSFVDHVGPGSRISIPLTWGGERQARLQLERSFTNGPLARIEADAGISRRENPHYEAGDTRTAAHVRAEGAPQRWLRLGAGGGVEDVQFGDLRDRLNRVGGDVTVDTRVDPAFPRNAVQATVGWEHLTFDAGHANRTTTDLRGFVGVIGQTVLAVRGLSVITPDPLPAYEKNLLGGSSTLRGYDAGYGADDNLAAVSAEFRVPISSPLSIGRVGVKMFADAGAAYPSGSRMKDQHLDAGYGAGIDIHLTILSISVDVAHATNQGTNVHFGMGVAFR